MTSSRHLLFLCRALLAAALPLLIAPSAGQAAEVLRVLAWPGYADPVVVRAFEKRFGVGVDVTYINSDADLWKKINSREAQDFDVFAVNTAELQRYIAAGVAAPIPAAKIANLSRQMPRFRNARALGTEHDGQLFGVPYAYSEMGLIYDRAQFSEAPKSIAILWDKRYRGKVVAYDGGTHNVTLAAQSLGLPSPFRIDEAQWPALVERLIALRRNVAGFYTHPKESVELFIRRRAAVMFANFGAQQIRMLQAAGREVGYVLPREGALAWLDCWVLARSAKNPRLAVEWINFMLDELASRQIEEAQGLSSTTAESPLLSADARLVWLQPVESEERRERLWERIMAGDNAARALSP